MTVLATTVQPGMAIAMGCGALSIVSRGSHPPAAAIGKVVMIEAFGQIIGCAKLTGTITLNGIRYPELEHPRSDDLRRTLSAKGDFVGPVLWVLEGGVLFGKSVHVEPGARDTVWPVPDDLHEELRAAYRAATERRKKA